MLEEAQKIVKAYLSLAQQRLAEPLHTRAGGDTRFAEMLSCYESFLRGTELPQTERALLTAATAWLVDRIIEKRGVLAPHVAELCLLGIMRSCLAYEGIAEPFLRRCLHTQMRYGTYAAFLTPDETAPEGATSPGIEIVASHLYPHFTAMVEDYRAIRGDAGATADEAASALYEFHPQGVRARENDGRIRAFVNLASHAHELPAFAAAADRAIALAGVYAELDAVPEQFFDGIVEQLGWFLADADGALRIPGDADVNFATAT